MRNIIVPEPESPREGYPGSYTEAAEVQDIDLRQIWAALVRNWKLVTAVTIVLVGAAAVYTARITPVYRASTSIRIDDKAGISSLAMLNLQEKGEINTELEMLRSRSLARMVADSLALRLRLVEPLRTSRAELFGRITVADDAPQGTYRLRRGPDGRFAVELAATGAPLGEVSPGGWVSVRGVTFRLLPGARDHETISFAVTSADAAAGLVQDHLDVGRRSREANIVDVAYEGTDPALVRDVPNALARHFIADRQDAQQTQTRSTIRFLREQIGKISGQLAVAENALRDFREAERVVSLPDQASLEVRRAADLQAQRTELETESAALAMLLSEVRSAAANDRPGAPSAYRKLVAFPTLLRNQAASGLLTSIMAAEDRRTELLSRRSPQDPEVQLLTSRVRDLETQLHEIAETYLQGLNDQGSLIDGTLATAGRRMDAIPAKEVRFARLQRDAKLLEEVYVQLQGRLKEAEIAEAVEDASVRVVDPARLPRWPIEPRPVRNFSLALFLGLMLGAAAAFVREYADRAVHSRRDVLAATGLPVLGFIPRAPRSRRQAIAMNGGRGKGLLPVSRRQLPTQLRAVHFSADRPLLLDGAAGMPIIEAFNRLETNLSFACPPPQTKVFVVTSPMPGEGKTTSAVNLAIAQAQRWRKVLLVDADLRRGVLDAVFKTTREPGLADALLGRVPLGDAVRPIDIGEGDTLHLLPRGTAPHNPVQLLASTRFQAMLEWLRDHYDAIIIDAPPLNLVTDAAVLGSKSDGVLIVARSGVTTSDALSFTLEQLRNADAPVVGVVLNDIDFRRDRSYDQSYRYYGDEAARYYQST